MKRVDFQLVLDKFDIKEADVYSYEEDWPNINVNIDNLPQIVKSNLLWCTITMKSGRQYIFKMHRLNKLIRTIDEAGYDLIVE
jgi:hypothetical protein